eukprot:7385423-Prymnesium_polylepis.1
MLRVARTSIRPLSGATRDGRDAPLLCLAQLHVACCSTPLGRWQRSEEGLEDLLTVRPHALDKVLVATKLVEGGDSVAAGLRRGKVSPPGRDARREDSAHRRCVCGRAGHAASHHHERRLLVHNAASLDASHSCDKQPVAGRAGCSHAQMRGSTEVDGWRKVPFKGQHVVTHVQLLALEPWVQQRDHPTVSGRIVAHDGGRLLGVLAAVVAGDDDATRFEEASCRTVQHIPEG